MASYEVCDLGIDNPSYFPGFGTAYSEYEYSVYGVGSDYNEALDDAIEMLAQGEYETIDKKHVSEKEIRRMCVVISEVEMLSDEDNEETTVVYDEGEEPDEDEPDHLYYHVGIRFTFSKFDEKTRSYPLN